MSEPLEGLQVERKDKEQALVDVIRRAAAEEGAEPGVGWREVRLGAEVFELPLLGRSIRRAESLGTVRFDDELVERLWHQGETEALQTAREHIAHARVARRATTEAELHQDLASLEKLIAALPESEQPAMLDEAEPILADPNRSLRKLRKRVRQFLVALRLEDRTEEVHHQLPELRIQDLKGSIRFELRRDLSLPIAGRETTVPVVAAESGGALEEAFLTQPPAEFAEQARALLSARVEQEEQAWRTAAQEISEFVQERLQRRFYDEKTIRKILREELANLERAPEDVARAVRARVRRLDAAAKEKETVWRLAHDNNLIVYKDFFSVARRLERKLIMYVGPTNSGKTWHALNQLCEAESGVYLAPLRLLALEGQEEIEQRGRPCSYITGEERMIREGAKFVASTIEMLDPTRHVDAAVIDEIQLLADEDRGWAWTQALVGVAAKKVFMTGSADAVPLVQRIAEHLGEPVEVHQLDRFTPLEPLSAPTRIKDIKPGTAVIAFSRRNVLRYKAQLAERFKVSVIYGNLTPEVRREEARRFRSGESEVVVATDAIAMGLNLPIETVLFSTLEKWNGKEEVELTNAQMLQIGGRAGRYGKYEVGYVGCLSRRDIGRIQRVFNGTTKLPPLPEHAQVRPDGAHIDVIADGIGTTSLKKALITFQRGMTFDPPIFTPGVTEDMIELAEIVDRHQEISMADRLSLSCAPVDTRATTMMLRYQDWVGAFAQENPVHLPNLPRNFQKPHASDDQELHEAEMEAKTLTVYAWLAYRYAEIFPDLERCQEQRQVLDDFIERSLARTTMGKACRNCNRSLPASWPHKLCDECFYEGY